MHHHPSLFATATSCLLAIVAASCASGPSGPVVPVPPDVEVMRLDSVRITPEAIHFVAKVAIHNRMHGPLGLTRVDYGATLFQRPLFDDTFTALPVTRARGTTTVTLPFRVALADVAGQLEDVLAESNVRVTLRGEVVPEGFAAIAFAATKVLPLPRAPRVTLESTQGTPFDGLFAVVLRVHNPNEFPLDFRAVDSFLHLNDRSYDLLRSEAFTELPPGGSGRIVLSMQQPRGVGLAMVLNALRNQAADFTISGRLACATPHGLFELPMSFGNAAAPPR